LGEPRYIGTGFNAASEEDLAKISKVAGASPIETIPGPGGGRRVRLLDPNGYQVEVVHGIAPLERLPVKKQLMNLGEDFNRAGELMRIPAGPAQVKRVGHFVMFTPKLAETIAWYRENLGLLPTDEVWVENDSNVVGSFNRCDAGDEYVDHHTCLFFSYPKAGLNHIAFEVNSIDEMFTGHEHLRAKNYEHMFGIGRHLLGSQIFDYWADPWGRVHEHWTDTDRLNAATESHLMDIREGFVSQWGGEPPEKLLTRVSP
jgi:hypothetical protein